VGRASARREDALRLNAAEREIDSLKRLLAVMGMGSNGVSACLPQRRSEGWSLNRQKAQCLWRQEGLRVSQRRRSRRRRS
jgi:hypothetical protein